MTEKEWDRYLKIETMGRNALKQDEYHHPYEPTPYCVLERLVESGYIKSSDKVIDYGCGKGRVGFFLNHEIGCSCLGIEYDENIFHSIRFNQRSFGSDDISFLCMPAEKYEVKDENVFYFFNPFTIEIFESVLSKIMNSYYENPRHMILLFYFADQYYVSCLLNKYAELIFSDEIDCSDLFKPYNEREKILVFEIEA